MTQPEFAAYGTTTCGTFGVALALGDLDHDGVDDLAIGDKYWGDGGRVVVLFGVAGHALPWRELMVNNGGDLTLYTPTSGAMLGRSLAIGDLDGDGIDDLVAAAVFDTGGERSRLAVIKGGPHLRGVTQLVLEQGGADLVIMGQELGDDFGATLLAKDLDNDGIADLAVGAPDACRAPGDMAGRAHVLAGGPTFFDQSLRDLALDPAELTVLGNEDSDSLAGALFFGPAAIGGPNLLWLGDPLASPLERQNAGAVSAIELPDLSQVTFRSLQDDPPEIYLMGDVEYFGLGSAVALTDAPDSRYLWLGSSTASTDGLSGNGRILVIDAAEATVALDLRQAEPLAEFGGEADGDLLGNYIFVNDFDQSGLDDVAISAWYAEYLDRVDAGKVYLFRDPRFDSADDDDDDDDADDDDSADDDTDDDDALDDDADDDDTGEDSRCCG